MQSARYIVSTKNFTLPNGTAIGANDVSEQVWFLSLIHIYVLVTSGLGKLTGSGAPPALCVQHR